jgi:SAM-dependent methyltransferase
MTQPSTGTCFSASPEGKKEVYTVEEVPANSVLLAQSREEARSFPSGTIELAFCPETGFLTNWAFAADRVRYNEEYEATQRFSNTFSAFHRRLAEDLIERYDLRNETILEIGCGQGEFLTLLCDLGNNEGIGGDFACRSEWNAHPAAERITVIQDVYSEAYAHPQADFVCCKMTLEHIPDVADFVGTVRHAVGDDRETVAFFQVPETYRILREVAFWDIYHEHCSYFSAGSLVRLFRSQGFEVEVPNALFTLREPAIWDLIYKHFSYFTPSPLVYLLRRAGFDVIQVGDAGGNDSASRLPAPCSRIPISSFSTRPPAISTASRSGSSSSPWRRSCRAAPSLRSPIGSRRSKTRTGSSCSRTDASWSRARTRSF